MTSRLGVQAMEETDATMLRLESSQTPFHTLKIAVLDPTIRGAAITLEEIVSVAPEYLGLSARLTQRVERREDRRWYWVDVPDVDINDHLDERTVSGLDGLDQLCGELAATHLDRSRPLWHLTLVHGLPGGQQAVVVRVHHAVMDGSAAMNAFTALTSDTRGVAPDLPVRPTVRQEPRAPLPHRLRAIARAARASRRRTVSFGPVKHVPSRVLPRTILNANSHPGRVCASRSILLDDVKEISRLTGVTTMAVVHAAIAQAVRQYLIEHGKEPTHPLIANFGVNADRSDLRCDGNRLATARVWMHVDDPVPMSLLARTAESCTESVGLRKARGFELQLLGAEFTAILPTLKRAFGDLLPLLPIHLLTAYVVGPTAARWVGDIRVSGFTSYAVSVAPFDPSITAYSYDGRLWLGVVTQPNAMPDPASFLGHVDDAVNVLLVAARAAQAARSGPRVGPQRTADQVVAPRSGRRAGVMPPPIMDSQTL